MVLEGGEGWVEAKGVSGWVVKEAKGSVTFSASPKLYIFSYFLFAMFSLGVFFYILFLIKLLICMMVTSEKNSLMNVCI